jgi:hypothetical protein
MKAHAAFLLTLLSVSISVWAQEKPVKIALTNASIVPSADIVKDFGKRCPDVTVTLDPAKADFMLEAGGDRVSQGIRRYKFTLFDREGNARFNTTTTLLGNAVKDVCSFLKK